MESEKDGQRNRNRETVFLKHRKNYFALPRTKNSYASDDQKPKTATLESQKQLFSKPRWTLLKGIKKTKKASLLSCLETPKKLFLKLPHNCF